jgi:hypothetical protein
MDRIPEFSRGPSGVGQQPTATLPKVVKKAQEKLAGWMNALPKNTEEQIVKQLGDPSQRTSWEFDGKKELLLKYQPAGPKMTLELYFLGDRVISASWQLLSEKQPDQQPSAGWDAIRCCTLIGCVLVVILTLGMMYWRESHASNQAKQRIKEAFKEFPDQKLIGELVDRHHDECFDACYQLGGRWKSSTFDNARYVQMMTQRIQDDRTLKGLGGKPEGLINPL